MSMEDILKVLVQSRGQASNTNQSSDPMADLVGSLLGGGQPQAPVTQNAGGTDLSGMMGMLEMLMGGQSGSTMGASNDPIMALLTPFVAPLAKKANIPPEIAMIVITFVVHKLLAHHPTSGRDSNSFDLDNMLGQMGTGKIDTSLLRQSGMVTELSKKTGLDDAQTEQALQLAFATVGKAVSGMVKKSGKPSSTASKSKTGGKSLGATGAKRGGKIKR